jgi:integrase
MGVLRKMINWGIRERLLKRIDNPVAGMQDNLPKKRKKERVLTLEEAQIVWQAAGTLGYPFGPLYRLILLTGCRPGEWAHCRQSYIDLKNSLLVIPAQAYISDHVHVVPLVPSLGARRRQRHSYIQPIWLREENARGSRAVDGGSHGR